MSIETVITHRSHSLHPVLLEGCLAISGPKNTICPVCGDEIVEAQNAVLHADADYPFDPQYFTHPECDSVTIGEAL